MNTLPENILQCAQSLPEGGVLSPKEFLHQGNRAAVDQAFSRLTKEGKLLRVARGTYVAPVSSRFGSRAPAPEKVVKSLSRRSGEILVKHAPRWMLALGTRPAGAAVRALDWIGPAHADKSLASLHRTLPRAEWKALASARATLPSWMAQAIGKEAALAEDYAAMLADEVMVEDALTFEELLDVCADLEAPINRCRVLALQ